MGIARGVVVVCVAALVALCARSARGQCTETWLDGTGHALTDGTVLAATSWTPSAGAPGAGQPLLIIAGDFRRVDRWVIQGVAAYDGVRWSRLGQTSGGWWRTYCVAVDPTSNDVFIGTDFGVKRYDGTSWTSVSSVTQSTKIYALAFNGGLLYAAGEFTAIGADGQSAVTASNVAKCDLSTGLWSGVGAGLDAKVNALAVHSGEVYAGGVFLNSGATPVARMARLSGGAWVATAAGLPVEVLALRSFSGQLYAGTVFSTASGLTSGVVRWNGSTWLSFGGLIGTVRSLHVNGVNLYVGGDFPGPVSAPGSPGAVRLGSGQASFTAIIGTAPGQGVGAMTHWNSKIFIAGGSDVVAGVGLGDLKLKSEMDGSYTNLNIDGTNGSVDVLHERGTDVLAAGTFTIIEGSPQNGLAQRTGGAWQAVPGWVSGVVRDMTTDSQGVVVMGQLLNVGVTNTGMIARLTPGNVWQALGTGISDTSGASDAEVKCGVVFNNDLFVGGKFNRAGGLAVSNVARFSAGAWFSTGTVLNGDVRCLAIFNGSLYAGGDFRGTPGVGPYRIARWNGTAWVSVGSGINFNASVAPQDYYVTSMVAHPLGLFVGGFFNRAGSTTVSNVALWNGTTWDAAGTGPTIPVGMLYGYVDRTLTSRVLLATDNPGGGTDSLQSWNGTGWSDFGGGAIGGPARAALWNDPDGAGAGEGTLYIGGDVTGLGGRPGAVFVTRRTCQSCQPATIVSSPSAPNGCLGSSASMTVTASGSAPLSYQWNHNGFPISGATSPTFSIASVAPGDGGVYDCLVSNTCGSVLTAGIRLNETMGIAITAQPVSVDICAGNTSVSFSVTATGSPPITYQWYSNGIALGATNSPSYNLIGNFTPGQDAYFCDITNPCGTLRSQTALLRVFGGRPSNVVLSPPEPWETCQGVPFTMSVSATDATGYAWIRNGASIPGATGPSYSTSVAGNYSCTVFNACGPIPSQARTLLVAAASGPSIVQQPTDQTACPGGTATMSVNSSISLGTAAYQWRRSGFVIAGATGASLVISPVQVTDAGMYDCTVSDACGSVTSAQARLRVCATGAHNVRALYSTIPGHPTQTIPGSLLSTAQLFGPVAAPFGRPARSAGGNRFVVRGPRPSASGPPNGAIERDPIIVGTTSPYSAQEVMYEGYLLAGGANPEILGTVGQNMGVNDSGRWAIAGSTRVLITGLPWSQVLLTGLGTTFSTAARAGTPSTLSSVPGSLWGTPGAAHILTDGRVAAQSDDLELISTDTADVAYVGTSVLVQSGVTVPSGQLSNVQTVSFLPSGDASSWRVSGDGLTTMYSGSLNLTATKREVLVRNGSVVMQSAFGIPGSGVSTHVENLLFCENGPQMSPNGAQWLARGRLETGTDFVVRNGMIVKQTGQVLVPGASETFMWQSFASLSFFMNIANNRGDWLIAGRTAASGQIPRTNVYVLRGTKVVLRSGDPVDMDSNGLYDDDVIIGELPNTPDRKDAGVLTENLRLYFSVPLMHPAGPPVGEGFLIADLSVIGCLADFNLSGSVTIQDLFEYLSAYFSSSPSADINNINGVTVQDLFEFLALWFAGCS